MRRDAIEQILCHFRLDLERLRPAYGDVAGPLAATAADLLLARAPEGALTPWRGGFVVAEGRRSHTRLIAAEFDAWLNPAPARQGLAV